MHKETITRLSRKFKEMKFDKLIKDAQIKNNDDRYYSDKMKENKHSINFEENPVSMPITTPRSDINFSNSLECF